MDIVREMDGMAVKIKLTKDELYQAFLEQQLLFDMDDMKCYLEDYETAEGELVDSYGVTIAECLTDEAVVEMAKMMRKNIDKYEMSWEYARTQALEDWSAEMREIDPLCLDDYIDQLTLRGIKEEKT